LALAQCGPELPFTIDLLSFTWLTVPVCHHYADNASFCGATYPRTDRPGLEPAQRGRRTTMRPRVAIALLAAGLGCLLIALVSESTQHRFVGLAGAIAFSALYVAEHRRPNPP
jgi:hypothetical protein